MMLFLPAQSRGGGGLVNRAVPKLSPSQGQAALVWEWRGVEHSEATF